MPQLFCNFLFLHNRSVFLKGPEGQREEVKSSTESTTEVPYKNPQEASDATKKEGDGLVKNANDTLDNDVTQLGITFETPEVDVLPGSISEDKIKNEIAKGYPEVTDAEKLKTYATRINIMKENFMKDNKREMKYGESTSLIVESTEGDKKIKREFILFCDSKKAGQKTYRFFAQW